MYVCIMIYIILDISYISISWICKRIPIELKVTMNWYQPIIRLRHRNNKKLHYQQKLQWDSQTPAASKLEEEESLGAVKKKTHFKHSLPPPANWHLCFLDQVEPTQVLEEPLKPSILFNQVLHRQNTSSWVAVCLPLK